jgi:hypothetical protein
LKESTNAHCYRTDGQGHTNQKIQVAGRTQHIAAWHLPGMLCTGSMYQEIDAANVDDVCGEGCPASRIGVPMGIRKYRCLWWM